VRFEFGEHLLDVDRQELHRGGDQVAVEPQIFDLLVYLVQNRERVVSRDDLIVSVWGSTADRKNGPGLLSPTRRTRDVGAAATSGDRMRFDLVRHAIGSWKRAQTFDPNQRPANCPRTPKPDL
jgi:hypothetical protein